VEKSKQKENRSGFTLHHFCRGSLMQAFKTFAVRLFTFIFICAFGWVAVLVVFRGSSLVFLRPHFILLGGLALAGVLAGAVLLSKKSISSNIKLSAPAILAAGIAVYFILQLIVAIPLRTRFSESWDFCIVAQQANDYVLHGTRPTEYFLSFPNNIPLFFLLTGVFRLASLFGATDMIIVGVVFNIIVIDAAILITCYTAKEVCKSRMAAFLTFAVLLLCLPLLMYAPIFYTDTLSLPFPIMALAFWQRARELFKGDKSRKACLFTALAALAAGLGTLLKVSVALVLAAIFIDILIQLSFKRAVAAFCVSAAVFGAAYFPINGAMRKSAVFPPANAEYEVPWTHWVMMGLHGNGNYYDPDYRLTLSVPANERKAFIADEIVRRISDFGWRGMLAHLDEKAAFVWGEGTYYSSVKLNRSRAGPSALDRYILYLPDEPGTRFEWYAYASQWHILFLVAGFVVAGVFMLVKRDYWRLALPFALSIFGIFLFELIWEARSRYLLHFLPVFAVLAVLACCEAVKRRDYKLD